MAHEVLRLSKQKSRTRNQGAAWCSKAVRFPTLALSRSGSEGCPFGLSASLGRYSLLVIGKGERLLHLTFNDSRLTTQAPLATSDPTPRFFPVSIGHFGLLPQRVGRKIH
jgi:hypothetical protein